MSEERPKLLTITIRPREGETERLNVFNAEEWMDTTAGKPGRFRLRRNGAWVRRGREKYTFFTGQGVQRYLATLLEDKGLCLSPEEPSSEQLALRAGDCVCYTEYVGGFPSTLRTRVAEDPVQVDGDWLVRLVGVRRLVYLVDVELVRSS